MGKEVRRNGEIKKYHFLNKAGRARSGRELRTLFLGLTSDL